MTVFALLSPLPQSQLRPGVTQQTLLPPPHHGTLQYVPRFFIAITLPPFRPSTTGIESN